MTAPAKPGGFKLSFAGAKSKIGLKKAASNPAKRPRLSALGDDEPEETETRQAISGFDLAQGGAVEVNGKPREEKKLMVIPAVSNNNWRDEARRRHAERTGHGQQVVEGNMDEEKKMAYGLTILKKEKVDEVVQDAPAPVDDGLTDEQRLEKKAIEALLTDKAPVDATTIPLLTEEAAFAADLASAPDAPSLDAYEATPIEGFGAALLRGMGWKDGEELGRNKGRVTKPRQVKPRPALLGIGAKDEAAAGLEPTPWEKGKPKRKAAQTYNPVALRSKITGELITEDELRERLERQKLDEEKEQRERRAKQYEFEDEAENKSRQKETSSRNRDEDYPSERRHRDGSRDPRRQDDSYDDRRRERRRDKRHRSRSADTDDRKSKSRHRDRSRSPDTDHKSQSKSSRRDRSRSRGHGERRERSRDRYRDGRKRRRDYYDDERGDRRKKYRN
ncbi:hypothetical protein K504DRAFT_377383 [Pleomassaria siparia CBS 279.74]|uniref:Pre-mRNA-splicing factor n=1 Tax=Pleomassaria siparia CBS 279.74 TaxID=1314801 RepID=A0A6G1KBX6_9PLEO|nr:hypothetical protein K504DRAFT_377383 [Pleomassaria siparia CBS 279.74]